MQARTLADTMASVQSEVHELRACNEELKRELRVSNSMAQELKDAQQGYALKSMVPQNAHDLPAQSDAISPSVQACSLRTWHARSWHPRSLGTA